MILNQLFGHLAALGCGSIFLFRLINVPAMAESHHQHHQVFVLDPTNEPVVIDAVAPEFGEFTLEAFAELTGLLRPCNPRVEECENPASRFRAKLAELFERLVADLLLRALADDRRALLESAS